MVLETSLAVHSFVNWFVEVAALLASKNWPPELPATSNAEFRPTSNRYSVAKGTGLHSAVKSNRLVALAQMAAGGGNPTAKVFVAGSAANQLASPSCEASTATTPAPLKERFVPAASISPGPVATRKTTAKPESAVADNPTTSVAQNALPLVGTNAEMAWLALATVSVPRPSPAQFASWTVPVTA